ncbi:PDR/VanB family oxidoreductase [Rhodococcus rhodochrous]|uniref:PDR/VanB family oxidoreductase n=1 Tax=Rhodococcus rhodochrous TaxID=1829 RepID=UPI001E594FA5|nr:PDR/VanB family oxidoreductase [Rhodococcus rhodochrous]MCD2098464.1 PDR/VanB family oxidoreductase [Rhodococcus rhodochrous]MCD2123056.1 PDR/VanB family oxidoreductase [Rhodococcus rhodochrous]MCQ4135960.1 PDR/VanB family oxidoreductase [Rhodococcus rhodochrous]MDJ0019774.1 PDR/VanB family oxidoreductase [Rhodococcus rhodochrous]
MTALLERSTDRTPRTRSVRVTGITWEAEGILSVTLADPAGDPMPAWDPGAHVDMELAPGLTRQYSLCGDPADLRSWTVAVRAAADSRGGSAHVHSTLRPGDILRVQGPRQHFPLEDAPAYVFVAGGIGITPLLPMIEATAARGATVSVHYAYSGQAPARFVERLAATGVPVHLHPSAEGRRLDLPTLFAAGTGDALVYSCGPEGMLTELTELLPAEALRIESFSPAPAGSAPAGSAPASEDAAPSSACSVQLGADGPVVEVAEDESVLDALERAGADVMWSCREGTCGSCEVGVLSGKIDHRDNILLDDEREEGKCFFPCVSRPISTAVLDL